MKKKIITGAIALSIALGGATMASASVDGTVAKESQIEYTQLNKDETVQPMFWAALGRAVAAGFAWESVFGSSAAQTQYDYEEVKESFDY